MAREHTYATLIIGAGFTGLGTAIKLAEAGLTETDDVVILERADRVGGTWRDTTYPGASCDVPSLLYSYSFVKNPTWSRTYSPAPEICRHLEDMATRFDIRRHIRLRPAISAGRQAIGMAARSISGWLSAQTKPCMQPIDVPIKRRSLATPSRASSSRCASTMSA